MSQTDFNVVNASGAAVRADINAHLDAGVSLSSGSTAPSTTFPNQWWYDTSVSQLKRRNNANTAWFSSFLLDTVFDTNGNAINESEGTAVASASSPNIWATDGNTLHLTGSVTITGFAAAPRVGAWRKLIMDATPLFTDGANLIVEGNVNFQAAAGDIAFVYAETTTQFRVFFKKADGTPVVATGGKVEQVVNTQTGAVATGTTIMPTDDTIPQNTEGNEFMTLTITPKDTANILIIEVVVLLASNQAPANGDMNVALFQDATAGALASMHHDQPDNTKPQPTSFRHKMTAGTTSATTFKVRAGIGTAGTTTFNGTTAGARILGGVLASSITITEYTP